MTTRVPATIVTGFLGAGKTSLVRHILAQARGRRIAVIVNEFGELGIDGDILRGCGIEGCDEDSIVELSNGCLCCTVADDFIPALEALLDRPAPPEHIIIETSGLALPKPLLKAFGWPAIRARVTVDGVIAVLDAAAVADGRFADDPAAVAAQREADPGLDHDNPLAEVFEDQIDAADLVVLNKVDLLDAAAVAALSRDLAGRVRPPVQLLAAREGRLDPAVLLGLDAAAENDLACRPSHHDALDGEHEHDDFTSFVATIGEAPSPEVLVDRLRGIAEAHGILRLKGYAAIAGKSARLLVQGVGGRFRHEYERDWVGPRAGRLVVIGRRDLDRAAIETALGG